MSRYALISCTKLKKDYRCSANEMYLESQLFKKAVQYVNKQNYDDWFILSAKYGLLHKDTVIEPYDITLNNMNSVQRRAWSKDVYEQLIQLNPNHLDFYAGKKYREYLIPPLLELGIHCNVPLEGKGIGEQLGYYKQQLDNQLR
jgi:Fe-S cluster biosynthesis and repair protein YggX